MLAKRKGVTARWGLKEAWSKPVARRTETGYEAAQAGRATIVSRSPHPSRVWVVYPAGVRGRRSGLPRETWETGKGGPESPVAANQESAEGANGVQTPEGPNGPLRGAGGKWKGQ